MLVKSSIAFASLVALALVACSDSNDDASTPSTTADSGTVVDTDAASTEDGGTPAATKDIVDTAVGAGSFTTLVSAVQAAELEATLRSAGPFTVFAPTDDAFKKVPDFLLTKLVTAPYKAELGLILKYHVLSGKVAAADVLNKTQSVDTVAGAKLAVDGTGGKVVLNGSINVSTADVQASNGVIHVVDGVILPSIIDTASNYVDGATKFSTLVAAIKAADLVTTLSGAGPFTVFAPTDAAFAKLPAGTVENLLKPENKATLASILTYHVVSGAVYQKDVAAGAVKSVQGENITVSTTGGVKVNDANVVLTDLPASNGVIHVIDSVILPPSLSAM